MVRPLRFGALLLAAAAPAVCQTPISAPAPTPVPGFTERVEVNIRTIFAVVVDPKGLAGRPLGPGDVQVLEDGIPAQVIGVDPDLRPVPKTIEPPPGPGAASSAPAETRPAGPIQTLPQFLYVDTALMHKTSVKHVAEAVEKNLDAILSRGSLEIVVADPDPKIFMSRTSDAAEIRRRLEELSRKVSGRERMLDIRRDLNPRIDANPASRGPALGGSPAPGARAIRDAGGDRARRADARTARSLGRRERIGASRDRLPGRRRLRHEPRRLLGEPAPGRRIHGADGAGKPDSQRNGRRDSKARCAIFEDSGRVRIHGGHARARPPGRDPRGGREPRGSAARIAGAARTTLLPPIRTSGPGARCVSSRTRREAKS